MSLVSYGVFTCIRHLDLAKASLETCLRDQPFRLLNDVDRTDVRLKMHSLGVKLLRWLHEPFDTKWTMLVDDDTWVNASVVERVCERIDSDAPTIIGYGCMKTPLDKGGYGDVFGEAAYAKAQRWWANVTSTPGYTTFWHAGAGMLLNRTLVEELRTTAFNGKSKLSEACIHSLERKGTPSQQVLSAVPQDKLMAVLISATRKRIHVKQTSLRGSSLIGTDGALKRDPPLNAWERPGNGIGPVTGRADKLVCDLNCSYPKRKDGEFDAESAASLVHANTSPRKTRTTQHVIKGEANLMTWHRFKRLEMFHQLDEAMRRSRR